MIMNSLWLFCRIRTILRSASCKEVTDEDTFCVLHLALNCMVTLLSNIRNSESHRIDPGSSALARAHWFEDLQLTHYLFR